MNNYLKIAGDYYKEVKAETFVPHNEYYCFVDRKPVIKTIEKRLSYKPKNNTSFDPTTYIVVDGELLKNRELWFIEPKIPNNGEQVWNDRGRFK